jgi:hypothetical protein
LNAYKILSFRIWRLSEVGGKLDYWKWDGNPSSPVRVSAFQIHMCANVNRSEPPQLTLSHELGSDTTFIIEKIA